MHRVGANARASVHVNDVGGVCVREESWVKRQRQRKTDRTKSWRPTWQRECGSDCQLARNVNYSPDVWNFYEGFWAESKPPPSPSPWKIPPLQVKKKKKSALIIERMAHSLLVLLFFLPSNKLCVVPSRILQKTIRKISCPAKKTTVLILSFFSSAAPQHPSAPLQPRTVLPAAVWDVCWCFIQVTAHRQTGNIQKTQGGSKQVQKGRESQTDQKSWLGEGGQRGWSSTLTPPAASRPTLPWPPDFERLPWRHVSQEKYEGSKGNSMFLIPSGSKEVAGVACLSLAGAKIEDSHLRRPSFPFWDEVSAIDSHLLAKYFGLNNYPPKSAQVPPTRATS